MHKTPTDDDWLKDQFTIVCKKCESKDVVLTIDRGEYDEDSNPNRYINFSCWGCKNNTIVFSA